MVHNASLTNLYSNISLSDDIDDAHEEASSHIFGITGRNYVKDSGATPSLDSA